MAKNLTNWSNNDTKPATAWSATPKNTDVWIDNDVKPVTAWQQASKNVDAWQPMAQKPQTTIYNDGFLTYNSPLADYDFLINNNTLSGKNTTRWSIA